MLNLPRTELSGDDGVRPGVSSPLNRPLSVWPIISTKWRSEETFPILLYLKLSSQCHGDGCSSCQDKGVRACVCCTLGEGSSF